MKLFVIVLALIIIQFNGSEAQNNFVESLNEVKTTLYESIEEEARDQFNQQYISAIDYFEGTNFEEFYLALFAGKHDNKTCHICNQAIVYGKTLLKNAQVIQVWAKSFCAKQKNVPERVCYKSLVKMSEPMYYIVQNTKLNSAEVCSVLLHPDCMTHLGQKMTANVLWEVPLPEQKEFKPLEANLRPLKMLHISDFHTDLRYTTGSNSRCDEAVCCHSTSLPPSNGENRSAGYWSETDFSCDTPDLFVNTTLQQIADQHQDIDFIIWTGDSVAHDWWDMTHDIVLKHMKISSDNVRAAFNNIPVYPSLGNHDTYPGNFYVPSDVPKESNLTMSWLYDTLSDDYWSQWISTESAKKSFKRGGYFSALVNKGLKVIVLNDGISDKRSYWIAHTSNDPDQQIKWLIEELDESETNGRYAVIIGHYPPSDCYLSWANNYFIIVERYRHVIAGTYFGHTHQDEIAVFHNKNMTTKETYPVSVGFIGPSITTFPFYNPGYRVFSLDKYGRPLDFSMYYTDIESDNERGPNVEPEWKLAYSAKEMYGVSDMSPESWDQFITRAQNDVNLTENYYNNYHRFSEVFTKKNKFNITKKKSLILNRRIVNPINSLLQNE